MRAIHVADTNMLVSQNNAQRELIMLNASQSNMVRVGFALFVALGTQRKRGFQWNMDFSSTHDSAAKHTFFGDVRTILHPIIMAIY